MNDSMSILLATTILALGGLGLYMYKSTDNDKNYEIDESLDEDGFFGGSFWGSSNEKDNDELLDLEEETFEDEFKPRKRNNKTQRNKKTNSTSRRRY